MKCNESIAILMGTYNGDAYLSEQIDSILNQTFTEWHLYVHDDGSTDNTQALLQQYASQQPAKITILNYEPQGGACKNFLSLLAKIDATYYMFCDQDDVWFSDKIEKTYARMRTLEEKTEGLPIIVHTDLYVVDAKLNMLSTSFIKDQHIMIDRIRSFADYAATNTVTGCTMLFNMAAKQCMKRPYNKAIMHDAWICLSVAAHRGVIDFINEPLIKYRQHGNNTLGANDIAKYTWQHKLKNILQLVKANIRHYQEMNAVKPLSLVKYVKAKKKYKKG